MPRITAIKQQQKLKDRYSVYVDDKYSFSLSESALIESGITSGVEVSIQQLEDYKRMSQDDKLWGKVLRYAARRLRSEWEIHDYMRRNEASDELAERFVDRLRAIGMLNDQYFAQVWVDNRTLLKPSSKRKLRLELMQKHISEDIIREVLADDVVDERQSLRDLVVKKRRQTKYQDNDKLKLYLARQGFGFDDINAVLAED